MKTRLKDYIDFIAKEENGNPRQGHEYRTLHNFAGYEEIGIILRWKDGKLNDDGQYPAVEFQDCHIEHFLNGKLHNAARDPNGDLMPAIIADYGETKEYFYNGREVEKNFKVPA